MTGPVLPSGSTPDPQSDGSAVRLSSQQRAFLHEAAKHDRVSPSHFEGAGKSYTDGNYSRRAITHSSASKVLRRLYHRGFLAEGPGSTYTITPAGLAVIAIRRTDS